jgi:molybdenum cofactor synthesis domain-containing protein
MSERSSSPHSAAIIIVGSEIVEGTVADENGQWLTQRLQDRGIWPRMLVSISDEVALIAQAVRSACASVNYVVVSGGLGCTPDDVTRVAVASAFGVPLRVDVEQVDILERQSAWAHGELARAAATLPHGGQIIVGHDDGVRGFLIENVLVLPGNPPEMQAMFESFIRDHPPPAAPICRTTLSFAGTEDALRATLGEFELAFPEVELGSYADPTRAPARVTLVLRSRDQRLLFDACTWFDRAGLRSREYA